MTGLEIALFILGAAFIIISFFIVDNGSNSGRSGGPSETSITGEVLRRIGADTIEDLNHKSDLLIAESEDKLEAISNDKIIAVGEYSDQILEKINSNHKEVVFLYQMLNDKEEELKSTASKLENVRIECEKLIKTQAALEAQKASEAASRPAQSRARETVAVSTAYQDKQPVQTAEAASREASPSTAGRAAGPATVTVAGGAAPAPEAAATDTAEGRTTSQPAAVNTVRKTPAASETVSTGTAAKGTPAQTGSATGRTAGTTVRKSTSAGTVASTARTAAKKAPAQPATVRPIEAEGRDNQSLSRNEEVLALHRQGKSVMEISKLMGMGQGEVRLIINLYG